MTFGPSQSMNLGGRPSAYGDSFVALDLMKGADIWRYFDPSAAVSDPYVPKAALDTDPAGWLKHLPVINGAEQAVWGNVFYTQSVPPGQYILEWQGEGSLFTWQNFTQIAPNKILIDFQANYVDAQGNPTQDGISVNITATDPNNNGNYLHDIKLYRAEDADLIAAGEHFNPTWFDRIDDFRLLRTHDWQETNCPSNVNWTRNVVTDDQITWGGDGRGMPYKLLVEIANQTRSDLWINIPHTASDSFMAAAAAYVHKHLDPDLKLQVEFSNEYFTTIFDQYAYFVNGGAQAFGNASFAAGQFYGTRAAAMADIFAGEFGANSAQMRPVLTVSHQMFATGEAAQVLKAPAAVAQGGTAPVTHDFDVLATDGYLSWYAPDPTMGALIYDWMTDADGGFGRARDFLLNQLYTDLLPAWKKGRALADKYGLDFTVYEGGTLLLNGDGIDPILTDFAIRFTQSVELRAVYDAEVAAWATVGTSPFTWYDDVGRPGPWGDYGHWNGIDFLPEPRTGAITDALTNLPPWWTGDTRPASTFDNGVYRAGTAIADIMAGTPLDDRLYGLTGDDSLSGFAKGDRLWGGNGNDTLLGGRGADEVNGGTGNDSITGGNGRDDVTGGAGDDVFIYLSTCQGGDISHDFNAIGDHDSFALKATAFGGHPTGALLAGEFQSSNAAIAVRAAVRILYDRGDRGLFFDADGSGAQAAVLLVVLQPGAIVTVADISFF